MEILALRLYDHDDFIPPTTATPVRVTPGGLSRKIDSSDSSSPIPGDNSVALETVYGIVGPSIVTFGLIGNLLILFVVRRSSMTGKAFFLFQNQTFE